MESNYNEKEEGKINKQLVQEFFTKVYDEGNAKAIDEFVAPEFRLFNILTNRTKLKEDTQKLLDVFPDLKHTTEQIIAEGKHVAVFNKWKSSKGNILVASFLKMENRHITKWDEIPFFSKEIEQILEKELPGFIQEYFLQI